jgi:hypothetical protein
MQEAAEHPAGPGEVPQQQDYAAAGSTRGWVFAPTPHRIKNDAGGGTTAVTADALPGSCACSSDDALLREVMGGGPGMVEARRSSMHSPLLFGAGAGAVGAALAGLEAEAAAAAAAAEWQPGEAAAANGLHTSAEGADAADSTMPPITPIIPARSPSLSFVLTNASTIRQQMQQQKQEDKEVHRKAQAQGRLAGC